MDTPGPAAEPTVGQVTVRYWASAKAAAGTDHDVLDLPEAISLAALTTELVRRHPDADRLPGLLACCSVLLGDRPVASEDRESVLVAPGDRVEFLPPFAGG